MSDPYGYPYATTVKLLVSPSLSIELDELTPEPRPRDDLTASEAANYDPRKRSPVRTTANAQPPTKPTATTRREINGDKTTAWRLWDADKDGKLSKEERRQMYRDMTRAGGDRE
jgi:hypothetical protein